MIESEDIKYLDDIGELVSTLEKPVLPTYKTTREAALQLTKVERDLFTDIEERKSGNFIISGIEKFVSELDFTACCFAISQILYNQSYQSGNEDINSGVKRVMATGKSDAKGEPIYTGNIVTSLNDLCRLAYGAEPTTELKKRMVTLVDTIHKKSVEIKFPNGDRMESVLFAVMNKYYRKKDNAVFYELSLNPIFCYGIKNSFCELPQDAIKRLDTACKKHKQRKQAAHYLLLRWLSAQDKRTPHTLTIDKIIDILRMESDYKKNRGRADKQLLSVCETMVDIGILSKFEPTYYEGKRPFITKITFYLNLSYLRKSERKKDLTPE